MPNFTNTITGYAVGDSLIVRRTIDRVVSGLPAGSTVTKAWMTLKTTPKTTDPDDSNALIQKAITTTDVPGTGHIEDDGAGDVNPIIRFDFPPANTRTIDRFHRFYDIQVLLSTGDVYTGEAGEIFGVGDVTIVIA